MALNREQRRAMLAQELDGEDVAVVDVDAVDPAPEPVAAPVAPPQTLTLSLEQLQSLMTTAATAAVQAAGVQGGGDIGSQISQAIKENRDRIPEVTDADYHRRSHYHPAGKDAPRPVLIHPMYLGLWDEHEKPVPRYPIEDSTSTDAEIDALNNVVPGEYTIERNDGSKVLARVVDVRDGMNNIRHRVIAFPPQQFEKEHRNGLPSLLRLAQQLVA